MNRVLALLKKNTIFCLLAIQIIWLYILPALDGQMSPQRIMNYAGFALLSVLIVIDALKEGVLKKRDGIFWTVISFFGICAVSAVWALINGVPIQDVIRGGLPFVWFIYVVIITNLIDRKGFSCLIKLIGILSVVYAVRIFAYYFGFVYGNPGERVTFHLSKATSMMTLVGTLIYMYFFVVEQKKKKMICYFAMIFLCFVATIFTETKAMFLSLLLGIIIFLVLSLVLLRKGSQNKIEKKKIGILFFSVFICSVVLMGTSLGARWRNMIALESNSESTQGKEEGTQVQEIGQNDKNLQIHGNGEDIRSGKVVIKDQGSVSVRLIELRTALEHFRESPLLGKGLGYRWEAEGLDYGEPVIYMHNIIAFTALDFGLLGILYLVTVLFVVIKKLFLVMKDSRIEMELKRKFVLCFSMIAMAFVYANFFAVFRSIEYVIICSVFLGGLSLSRNQAEGKF